MNPAVSVGPMVGKRFAANDLLPYVAAQVAGGPGFSLAGGLDHSPGKYTMMAGLVTEVVLTFMFLMIILGSTDKRVPAGFAPIAIGWSLTLIHPVGIPVTNCL